MQTRRVYEWMRCLPPDGRLDRRLSAGCLRRRARDIWGQEIGPDGHPYVDFTRSGDSSWYHSDLHLIVLAPVAQNLFVLIHELTHALGYWEHDRQFMNKKIELLVRYAKADEGYLRLSAMMFGIKL